MHIKVVIPTYNCSVFIKRTLSSIASQSGDNFSCDVIDDCSDDETYEQAKLWCKPYDNFNVYRNSERKYALRNIVEHCNNKLLEDDMIICLLDGDDYLINNNSLQLISDTYQRENCDVLWSNYETNFSPASGFSNYVPSGVDVYKFPWSSSHMKTFKVSALKNIDWINFKNKEGEWFKRCYDQAIMLPLMHSTQNWYFLNEKLYHYHVDPETTFQSIELQAYIENFIRTRGYVDNANV